MAAYDTILINGVAYTPSGYKRQLKKVGRTLEAENGKRTFVQVVSAGGAAITKYTWSISFGAVTDAQRAALQSLALTTGTVSYRDMNGSTHTAQLEGEDYSEEWAFRSAAGGLYWNVEITLHEA